MGEMEGWGWVWTVLYYLLFYDEDSRVRCFKPILKEDSAN